MKHFEIHADGEHQTMWAAETAEQAANEWRERHGANAEDIAAHHPESGELHVLANLDGTNGDSHTVALPQPMIRDHKTQALVIDPDDRLGFWERVRRAILLD